MNRTGSSHKSIRIESWFKFCRNVDRIGSIYDSNRVKIWVEQGLIISQTRSSHKTNRLESPFERYQNQSRSIAESNRVES